MENSSEFNTFLKKYFDFDTDTEIVKIHGVWDKNIDLSKKQNFVNLEPINNFKSIVDYVFEVNRNLPIEGYFAGIAETYKVRKNRILAKYPTPFNWIYYTGDFILTRISPKISITKNVYTKITGGKGRVLSKSEILGILYYLGFELVDEIIIDKKWCYIVKLNKKLNELPTYSPSTGLLITLPRIGKNGKVINVYKFRTMHPYAEFLQAYIHELNSLKAGGKFDNDFRISTLGKFMRKYWIDEFPMFINLLKGEMKFVGVRPLSAHYLSLYEPELQKLRIKNKPGLLPPFYADLPKTLEEIQSSEKKYLEAYQKNPWATDFKYFSKIISNILFKGKRSA